MLNTLTVRWTEATRGKSQAQQLLMTIGRFTAVILLAMVVFGGVLLVFGKNPVEVYQDIFSSTLGSPFGRSEIVVKMIPLLLCATAVMLPARIGLVNVGGEGQLYLGAWLATGGALLLGGLPQAIALPAVLLLGIIGGGLWAAIPAFLRAKGWLNETISTLLLNYVAILFVGYFIFGVWKDPNSGNFPQTAPFSASTILPRFGETRIHWGLVFAITAVIGLCIVFKYTRWGYEMRAIGGNPEAARRYGISINRYILTDMFVAGGLAGLAGTCEVLPIQGRLIPGFSPGYGYIGFLISWLALHNPIGVVVMTFLVSIIFVGGDTLQITQGMPFASVNILMGLVLFTVLADLFKRGKTS